MSANPWDQQEALRGRPETPWVMRQRWEELLFLHWVWEEDDLQQRLPGGLKVQTFEGRAYLGLVPFFMRGVRPRGVPAVPGISDFLEMNLRTYVTDRSGCPGVWFFSLDCNQPLAVWTARTFFHLAYFHASMVVEGSAREGWDYRCRRAGGEEETRLHYRVRDAGVPAEPGTLEYFLVERYLLFSASPKSGKLWKGRVWHRPYALSPVDRAGEVAPVFRAGGFRAPSRGPDHATGSPGVDVWVHPLERVVS